MNINNPWYRIARHLRIAAASDGGLYLISERGSQHASSPLVSEVLKQAAETKTGSEIVASLSAFTTAEVLYVLSQLQNQGVLETAPSDFEFTKDTVNYNTHVGALHLVSDNQSALSFLEEKLSKASISHELDIVLTSDYLGPLVEARRSQKRPWIPVKLVGERCYFGPVFNNGDDVCHKCLKQSILHNRPVEAFLNANTISTCNSYNPTEQRLAAAAEKACAALIKLLEDETFQLSRIIEFDERNGISKHSLLCGCKSRRTGDVELVDDTPIRRRLGGYRKYDAEEIVSKLLPLVSDLTGLISSVGPLDLKTSKERHSEGRHVWAASYPIVPNSATPAVDAFHGVAMGKGLSETQAQASVLCEAVERISAQYRASTQFRQATYAELNDLAIHPNAVSQFSATQFRERELWNTLSTDERRHIPPAFRETDIHEWMPVWSITERKQKWMIRDLCFANAPEPRYGRFDPNGCAAGSTYAEASVQALLELIERDSVAIWWYNRVKRPAVDPRKSDDLRIRDLAKGLSLQGWDCWFLDLTTDLNIPCLAAVARARSDGRWCIGFGCHYEQALAAERAMTELVQLFRANGRDGPPPWSGMNKSDECFLYGHGEAQRQNAEIDSIETMGGLVDWTVEHLAKQGIETLVLNQTRKETGLCVVKVFAPGLRHFWPRFGGGRLYDVPVKMGWACQPLEENQLNRTHLFL